jgi:transposase-like protein
VSPVTRRSNFELQNSAEEKIRVVLDGLRGEHSIAELCRREGISQCRDKEWTEKAARALLRTAFSGDCR